MDLKETSCKNVDWIQVAQQQGQVVGFDTHDDTPLVTNVCG